jgi:NADH-quinone oxidoreductase subunit N
MNSVNYFELLKLAMPETIVVVTVLAVLAADLMALRGVEINFRRIICAMIASVGCVAAIGWLLLTPATARVEALGGMLVIDPVIQFVKIALLVLTIFTMLLSIDSEFTTHVGEYLALVLLGAIGMMFLVSAEDVLMIFIALELTSLSLYILTAFNKRDIRSAEAALKYFLFGGMSAAFMLFGLSLLYGRRTRIKAHRLRAPRSLRRVPKSRAFSFWPKSCCLDLRVRKGAGRGAILFRAGSQ